MPAPLPVPDTVVIVPVKPPARGKSRLLDLPGAPRHELAAAFARDTVAAALPVVTAVLVVTDDHRFAAELRSSGCSVIPDGVAEDLNAALRQAAAEAVRRWPGARTAALCADLPALTPTDLATALREAATLDGPAFVRDRAGSGTTLYVAEQPEFLPRFGEDSAAAHLEAGAVEVTATVPTLRQDVDVVGDLSRALVLGVGPSTAAVTGRA